MLRIQHLAVVAAVSMALLVAAISLQIIVATPVDPDLQPPVGEELAARFPSGLDQLNVPQPRNNDEFLAKAGLGDDSADPVF